MRLDAIRLGAVFTLLAVGLVGCDSLNEPVAPEQNTRVERNDHDNGPPGKDDDAATVYVVHGINGTDLGADEALPVDIAVNGSCVLEDVEFRDIEGPLSLEEGSYDLAVYLAGDSPCSGDPAIEASDVELDEDDNVSITAHLDASGNPTLTPFTNDVTAKPGKTRISARHAASFGAVDLVVDDEKPFTGLENGGQVGAFLRPGSHTVALTPAGTMTRVFELTEAFRPFTLYAAYAVGTPDNGTFEVLLQTIPVGPRADRGKPHDDRDDDDDDETATVYVVHGINGTDLGADEALPVDIAVNGSCVLEDVEFRDIEGPLSLEEGSYDLAVYLDLERNMSCEGDPAIEADDVELDEDDNVSITAHLAPPMTEGGDPTPTLTPFTNDVTAKPGKTRISARHAANFGAVDVVVDGEKPFTGVLNGEQVGAFLRPGSHTVALTPEGSETRVFELTSDFEPFTLYAAYAVGTPRSEEAELESTFEVLLQTIEVGPKAKADDDDWEDDDDDDEDDDDEDDDDGDDWG